MTKQFPSIMKRLMLIALSILATCVLGACMYMFHPKFGKAPRGKRLSRIEKSPNYKEGSFKNIIETPTFAEGYGFWSEVWKSISHKFPETEPERSIPTVKTNLHDLPIDHDIVIWFGHSSCYIQLGGKRILVDPVFSKQASPVPGSVKAFKGTSLYKIADIPPIDFVLITHDHYDHLDYESMVELKGKIKKVVCGLGVGAHLSYWGYQENQIIEKDWYESEVADRALTIHAAPARHKSGRGLSQNKTLWLSFILKSPDATIFISGDGGYGPHFKDIGEAFGPVDLAIMESGQYDSAWHYVHLLPEEALKAACDVKAGKVLPVHHSKFVLARHPWYEPLERITTVDTTRQAVNIITPMIGEVIKVNDSSQTFNSWWKSLR